MNHKRGHKLAEKKSHKRAFIWLIAVLILGLALGYPYFTSVVKEPTGSTSPEQVIEQNIPKEPLKKGILRTFSGAQFRDLYHNFAYPNTEYISQDAVITGDEPADVYIQKIAIMRGYGRRSAPVSNTFRDVGEGMLLQERASQPWLELQKAAKKEGVDLFLTAAFRSALGQREIFVSRLNEQKIVTSEIINDKYYRELDQILTTTAIPGYSRHHTGYTIDIGCMNDPKSIFDVTICFNWLSKDNYKNAKTFGWIPSYPEGAGKQGPDPETWEYVWVGTDAVTE